MIFGLWNRDAIRAADDLEGRIFSHVPQTMAGCERRWQVVKVTVPLDGLVGPHARLHALDADDASDPKTIAVEALRPSMGWREVAQPAA